MGEGAYICHFGFLHFGFILRTQILHGCELPSVHDIVTLAAPGSIPFFSASWIVIVTPFVFPMPPRGIVLLLSSTIPRDTNTSPTNQHIGEHRNPATSEAHKPDGLTDIPSREVVL